MLRRWLRWLYSFVLVAGVVLTLFAVLEVLRAYQALRDLHPGVGYGFLALIAALAAWLVYRTAVLLLFHRPPLSVPAMEDRETAAAADLMKFARYLARYAERLLENTSLEPELRDGVRGKSDALRDRLLHETEHEALLEVINATESTVIAPLLANLDEQANKHVRAGVRDVTLGVAVSPYHSLDILVVLYKNFAMLRRVILTYQTRPGLRAQVSTFRDILRVVATVNVLNVTSRLVEGVLSKLPGIGRVTDDIAQGLGAGLMTSIAGHAAMVRCRAFRGWDEEEAKATLMRNLAGFYSDVRGILLKDVLPLIRRSSTSVTRKTWDALVSALNSVGTTIGDIAKWPVDRLRRVEDAEPDTAPAS
jgi:uncharacterized membrane protein YcjF (UPF0283 family)